MNNENTINDALASAIRVHADLLIAKHLDNTIGPNNWDDIGPEDFGPEHDFDIEDHGSIVIVDCYSNAALQWCYKHLPQDCPRWGATGFAIEARYVGAIIEGMRRDALMTRQDFEEVMNEQREIEYAQWQQGDQHA